MVRCWRCVAGRPSCWRPTHPLNTTMASGGKVSVQRVAAPVGGDGCGGDAADVALAAAAVDAASLFRISCQWPPAARRRGNSVRGTGVKLQTTTSRASSGGPAAAQEAEHAVLGVVAVDPLEAGRVAIALVQGRLAAVERVQVAHPALQPAVERRAPAGASRGCGRGSTRATAPISPPMNSSFLPGCAYM